MVRDVDADRQPSGLISRHHRPVYWSPSSRTALAEAELEYDDHHKCTAAFVQLPFVELPRVLAQHPRIRLSSVSALIWTTTPWTLPANQAIAVNPSIMYSVISLTGPNIPISETPDQLLVAQSRVTHLLDHFPEDTAAITIVEEITGAQLVADGLAKCWNLFQGTESPILGADFVTDASGTGVVHMAPGHGMEDYLVCQKAGVGPAIAPVNDEGLFTVDVFPTAGEGASLAGLDVQTEGVEAVLELLRQPRADLIPADVHCSGSSLVLATHTLIHKNPIDWRTKAPVIVRATAQWFADVSAIKDRAIVSLDDVTFIPETGKARLTAFVGGRSQWCISRQRAWGVPIPALYHAETGEVCVSDESIAHIIAVVEDRGTDAWFTNAPDDPRWLCASLNGSWIRGKDTMDVWFDSGTTWTSLPKPTEERTHIADVYVEGTDQHRGWFQSSLLTHIAVQDAESNPRAPYAKLITHGFTLDAEGKKMSKSIGNVIAPDEIIAGSLLPPLKAKKQKQLQTKQGEPLSRFDSLGPDALRLWVASSDYTRDVSIAVPVLQEVQQALAKYRVTLKFLLGVLEDFKPDQPQLYREQLEPEFADRTVLHRLSICAKTVHAAYGAYEFHKGIKAMNDFINNDLSAVYLEIVKDRLYAGYRLDRHRTQTVLLKVLWNFLGMLGPVTPHLVQEAWEFLPEPIKNLPDAQSLRTVWIPLERVPQPDEGEKNAWGSKWSVEEETKLFEPVSTAVKLAQEAARRNGDLKSGLACSVQIRFDGDRSDILENLIGKLLYSIDNRGTGELADLLVVSDAQRPDIEFSTASSAWQYDQKVESAEGNHTVRVMAPTGAKCVRCWKFTAKAEGKICMRCEDVLKEKAAGRHE